tara:strand:+ start:3328 stop:4101 length:774 start_codon:yes stop_codon:yes gene_type:complete
MLNFLKTLCLLLPVLNFSHIGLAESSNLQVIFKLDDVRRAGDDVPDNWRRVYEFAQAQQVPVSMGVICNSLEGDSSTYSDTLKSWHDSGLVELWNHGYAHRRWEEQGKKGSEFSGTDLQTQEDTLLKSQELGKDEIGVVFTTFGAPYNWIDQNTVTAMENVPDLKVWLYGPSEPVEGVVVLKRNRHVKLEPKVGMVRFEQFRKAFVSSAISSPLVLQGHPGQWDDLDFADFEEIVAYLQEQGVAFALPRDFITPQEK